MTTHCMIDLETLGTKNGSALLSLGAVKFSTTDYSIWEQFYVRIDPKSCQQVGLGIDADTVAWWLHPDRALARDALLAEEPMDLHTALDGFADWYSTDLPPVQGGIPTWGNGATFDNVLLRTAFERVGIDCPWAYYNDRCFRTLRALANREVWDAVTPAEGMAHHALCDAVYQARVMQVIVKNLGLAI